MARLTPREFEQLIEILAEKQGMGRLQGRLLRLNAIVSRKRLGSIEVLARQLYPLTGGLEREAPVTRVLIALWEELLGEKIDEQASKRLDELTEKINECLTSRMELDPARIEDLATALTAYREELGRHVGETAALLTMLNRAVPDVARLLRGA